jgi:hypothetical protein
MRPSFTQYVRNLARRIMDGNEYGENPVPE